MRWIKWCAACRTREVNGRGDLCARCQADITLEIERLEEGLHG